MLRRMKNKRDVTDKEMNKTAQELRKPSFAEMQYRRQENSKVVNKTAQELRNLSLTEQQYRRQENSSERQHTGNMLEVDQVSTPSPRKSVSRDRRFAPVDRRLKATRGDSSVTPQLSDSQRRWLQSQGNEVKSRSNERTSNTRQLRSLKGGRDLYGPKFDDYSDTNLEPGDYVEVHMVNPEPGTGQPRYRKMPDGAWILLED